MHTVSHIDWPISCPPASFFAFDFKSKEEGGGGFEKCFEVLARRGVEIWDVLADFENVSWNFPPFVEYARACSVKFFPANFMV